MVQAYQIVRATAWLLVAATMLALFTGLFTTKYFVMGFDYTTLYHLHTVALPLVFLPLFYLHSTAGIMILLQRQERLNNRTVKLITGGIWTSLFLVFLLIYSTGSQGAGMRTMQGGAEAASLAGAKDVMLSANEIAKHNTANDCWLLINGKAYDVTSYLPYHPGGPEAIAPYCGQDATSAFSAKKDGKPHSPNAEDILAAYYIGDLGGQEKVKQAANLQKAKKPQKNREPEDD